MYTVTIVERTPTEDESDIAVQSFRRESMFDVLYELERAEVNFTCWESVNITRVKDNNGDKP